MKKIILVILLAMPILAIAQNHFKGSNYIDVTAALTDQMTLMPSVGYGHDFSDWFSLNARYNYSMPGKTNEYRFYHHSLDIFPKFVIHNFDDAWGINLMVGISQSINSYSEIPRPNFNPHVYNVGYLVGLEYENIINNNIALYSSITNRGYFLDTRNRFELLYQVGVRLNFGIFSKFFN